MYLRQEPGSSSCKRPDVIKMWSLIEMFRLLRFKRKPTYSHYACIVWAGALKKVS
jgi:hypothetical protein